MEATPPLTHDNTQNGSEHVPERSLSAFTRTHFWDHHKRLELALETEKHEKDKLLAKDPFHFIRRPVDEGAARFSSFRDLDTHIVTSLEAHEEAKAKLYEDEHGRRSPPTEAQLKTSYGWSLLDMLIRDRAASVIQAYWRYKHGYSPNKTPRTSSSNRKLGKQGSHMSRHQQVLQDSKRSRRDSAGIEQPEIRRAESLRRHTPEVRRAEPMRRDDSLRRHEKQLQVQPQEVDADHREPPGEHAKPHLLRRLLSKPRRNTLDSGMLFQGSSHLESSYPQGEFNGNGESRGASQPHKQQQPQQHLQQEWTRPSPEQNQELPFLAPMPGANAAGPSTTPNGLLSSLSLLRRGNRHVKSSLVFSSGGGSSAGAPKQAAPLQAPKAAAGTRLEDLILSSGLQGTIKPPAQSPQGPRTPLSHHSIEQSCVVGRRHTTMNTSTGHRPFASFTYGLNNRPCSTSQAGFDAGFLPQVDTHNTTSPLPVVSRHKLQPQPLPHADASRMSRHSAASLALKPSSPALMSPSSGPLQHTLSDRHSHGSREVLQLLPSRSSSSFRLGNLMQT